MVYEIRKFLLIGQDNKYDQYDIYIYKKGFPNIGVKFRDAQQKQYGWKIKQIEVKQIQKEQLIHNRPFIQKWTKNKVKMKFQLHVLQLSQFNASLKNILKESTFMNQQLAKWCEADIKELYEIKKNKIKKGGFQKGILRLKSIINKTQIYNLETQCVQSDQKQQILKQINKEKFKDNISYPYLLQIAYHNKLKDYLQKSMDINQAKPQL